MSRFAAQKRQVLDACLILADRGYLAGIGGNLALRLDDRHFAVTPSAADYYAMKAEDICVLRLDDRARIEGELKPSVESGLHAAMLLFHAGIAASVHTHQPLASAVALIKRGIPLKSGDPLGAEVTLIPYAPSGTGLLVRALSKRLKPGLLAYLLRNHGVICGAGSLDEAIAAVSRIEAAAARLLDELIDRQPAPDASLAALIGATLKPENMR
jgi:L-fuculose-phosphate aldolase